MLQPELVFGPPAATSIHPFELNCRIEERLEAIYELAQRRLSPSSRLASYSSNNLPGPLSNTEKAWILGNNFDGLTAFGKVTFLNGMTRCQSVFPHPLVAVQC